MQREQQNTLSNTIQDDRVFFSLIEKAGSIGRYQIASFALWCTIAYLIGGMALMTPFLTYQEPYDCSNVTFVDNCEDYICSLALKDRQKYIPESRIFSIASKFGDYRCSSQSQQLNSMVTFGFFGYFVGLIILTFIGDYYGRKTLMLSNLLITFVGLLLIAFSLNIIMAGIGMFLAAVGIFNCFNLSFLIIAQTVNQTYRDKFSAASQLFYSVGALSNVLWFYLIGNFQYIILFCYMLPALIAIVFVYFILKQTPFYLVTRYSSKKALKDFQFIAKFNKKDLFQMKIQDIQEIKQNYTKNIQQKQSNKKRFNIIDLFRYKSLRRMTVNLIIVNCFVTFIFLGPTFMLDKFNFNVFINGIIVEGSQLIGAFIGLLAVVRYQRRLIAIVCFSLCSLCSLALIFIWDQSASQEKAQMLNNVLVLGLVFILQLSISLQFTSFYVYFNQLYPTQVRVVGTSLVSSSAALFATFASMLIRICIEHSFKIMIVFTLFSIISLLSSYQLNETFGKAPPEVIEQLKNTPSESLISNSQDSKIIRQKV